MIDTSLRDADRLILLNQYRILARLCPQEATRWLRCANVLERGFTASYCDLFESLQEPLSRKMCDYVLAVLSLYSALQESYAKMPNKGDIDPKELRFPGFDGNSQPELLGFARHLRSRGRFEKLDTVMPDWNSHHDYQTEYRRMISTWRRYRSSSALSLRQIRGILSAVSRPDED